MKTKVYSIIFSIVGVILLIPFIAMQFTDEVKWSPFDFMVMGILLFTTGIIAALIWTKIKSAPYRIAFLIALVILLLLVWIELAVGIFGTPFAGS